MPMPEHEALRRYCESQLDDPWPFDNVAKVPGVDLVVVLGTRVVYDESTDTYVPAQHDDQLLGRTRLEGATSRYYREMLDLEGQEAAPDAAPSGSTATITPYMFTGGNTSYSHDPRATESTVNANTFSRLIAIDSSVSASYSPRFRHRAQPANQYFSWQASLIGRFGLPTILHEAESKYTNDGIAKALEIAKAKGYTRLEFLTGAYHWCRTALMVKDELNKNYTKDDGMAAVVNSAEAYYDSLHATHQVADTARIPQRLHSEIRGVVALLVKAYGSHEVNDRVDARLALTSAEVERIRDHTLHIVAAMPNTSADSPWVDALRSRDDPGAARTAMMRYIAVSRIVQKLVCGPDGKTITPD